MHHSELDSTPLFSGLHIGSAPSQPSAVGEQFDCLVLCAREYQPGHERFPGVRVAHFPFDDVRRPAPIDIAMAKSAAEFVARRLGRGERVLVTCMAGRNRSGFVCAITLHLVTGAPGTQCADFIAKRRTGPDGHPALTNTAFRGLLRELR